MKRAAETETASGLSLKKPGRLSPSAGPVRPGIPALFILVIFGLILAVLVIGWKSLRLYAEKFEQEINAHLTAIAELKAAEITQWRRERLLDAAYLERNTLLADLVRQVLQNPTPSEAVRRLEPGSPNTWPAANIPYPASESREKRPRHPSGQSPTNTRKSSAAFQW